VNYHPTLEQIEAANGKPIGAGEGQLIPETVVIAEWNDRAGVEAAFADDLCGIGAIICEPLLCNSGCIPPEPGFLQFLRDITSKHGALLIFDEVITGFRVSLGGAQELYNVTPDLATYAKAVGAGMPLSVLAGKGEFMDLISSDRAVHAGTLNGNPMSLAAAKYALDYLSHDSEKLYRDLRCRGERLRAGIQRILCARGTKS